MKHREVAVQIQIIRYLRTVLPHGWRISHSPNGGARDKREAAKLKAMGVLAGWPDVMICGRLDQCAYKSGVVEFYAEMPFVGFLEIKAPAIRGPGAKPNTTRIITPAGTLSDEQTAVMDALQDLGFPVAVVDGIDATRAISRKWGLPLREVNYEPMGATS